jgi:hypothetical protein
VGGQALTLLCESFTVLVIIVQGHAGLTIHLAMRPAE